MIHHVTIHGLNGQEPAVILNFHPDLNILTGKNGSGKTTVLKLIWYAISGHLDRVLTEVMFEHLSIVTDSVELRASKNTTTEKMTVEWNSGDGWERRSFSPDRPIRPAGIAELTYYLRGAEQSLFFPTFRRIEGGFSSRDRSLGLLSRAAGRYGGMERLQTAMQDLSSDLSIGRHQFVASISTHDIIELLTTQYAGVSEQVNHLHEELSASITSRIEEYSISRLAEQNDGLKTANDILRAIQDEVNRISSERETAFQPFLILSDLIGEVFQYQGIRVTEAITLGDTREAIASDKLSAGEKQMLSFLCYNAFSQDSIIFIDEPELSLHTDWQRRLFPTLMAQATNNQFIVATHSPFIYSKYPDKELVLDLDRGDAASYAEAGEE
jgi:predicted ATPase